MTKRKRSTKEKQLTPIDNLFKFTDITDIIVDNDTLLLSCGNSIHTLSNISKNSTDFIYRTHVIRTYDKYRIFGLIEKDNTLFRHMTSPRNLYVNDDLYQIHNDHLYINSDEICFATDFCHFNGLTFIITHMSLYILSKNKHSKKIHFDSSPISCCINKLFNKIYVLCQQCIIEVDLHYFTTKKLKLYKKYLHNVHLIRMIEDTGDLLIVSPKTISLCNVLPTIEWKNNVKISLDMMPIVLISIIFQYLY